jgi:hypothetical protein
MVPTAIAAASGLKDRRAGGRIYSAAAFRAPSRSISACTAAADWPTNSAWCVRA